MGRSRGSKKRGKEDAVGKNNVNGGVVMAAKVRKVKEVLTGCSEQEIREMLLRCDMNHYEAIQLLLSQQDTSNEQGISNELPDSSTTSVLVPNQSTITNGVTRTVPLISSSEADPSLPAPSSSCDVTNGETKDVPVSSGEVVALLSDPSSSAATTNGETTSVATSSNPSLSVPSSSDVTNGETRTKSISSSEAVPPLSSEPSSSAITNGETRSVPTSSNVALPPLSVSSSRAITKVKPKRQDTRMISASGPSMAEILRGLHVPSKQNATKSPVKADSPLKPDATNPISNSLTESDAARDPQHSDFSMETIQSIATESPLGPSPPTFMAETFGTYPSTEPNINQQGMNWGQDGNNMNDPPYLRRQSQNSPPPAPIQKRGGTSNTNTLPHHVNMINSPHTWLDQDDASIYQSMDSVFAQYRNNTLSLSSTSTVPSSHGSAYDFDMFAANSRLGYEDISRIILPSNTSGTSSTGPSLHGSAYGYDMTSGNAANSRFGYEDVSRYHLNSSSAFSIGPSSHVNAANSRLGYKDVISGNHLPSNSRMGYGDYMSSVPHQGRSPFEWRVEGEDSYRSIPSRNQQEREAYFERLRAQLASSSLDQEYNTTSDEETCSVTFQNQPNSTRTDDFLSSVLAITL